MSGRFCHMNNCYVLNFDMKKTIYLTICTILLASSVCHADAFIKPSDMDWLPSDIEERLKKSECQIPLNIEWGGGIKIPARGILVGQFAAQGQYDIAVICNAKNTNRIFIHWGGPQKCSNEFINNGESIEVETEETVRPYLQRYGSDWPSKLTHDAIGMYIFGKSSFYKYCHNGEWLHSDGAD